ncbi:MAG: PKD domain-containing protein [Marinilabiliales bacterium]|nr:PKD domain-containing protein [Marinilabiliales bacterium]
MKKFKLASLLFLGLLLAVACKKDTPAPTATFTATVNDGVVSFAAEVTNDTKYEWDFGDGSYINTLKAPVHTYLQGPNPLQYTVALTIKGPGGQVTTSQTITIPAKTKMQFLTGGTPANPKSKKWRIAVGAPSFNINFATATFSPNYKSYPGGILSAVGLSAVYNDTFEFKSDGTMKINSNGGGIFAGYVYCVLNGVANIGNAGGSGLTYAKPYTAPTNATFTINENKDYTLTTAPDGVNATSVTYAKVTTLSFTNGGFLGIKDFVSECVIQSLNDTQMVANLFVSAVTSGQVGKPNFALNVYFEVAP